MRPAEPVSEPAGLASVTECGFAGVTLANPDRRPGAEHLAWTLGDDVDRARQGVRAPDRRSRSARHFDLLDVIEPHGQQIPEDHAEVVLVDGPAVEERERAARVAARRAAGDDLDVAS